MKSININHAYSGFLYAPLFLADELGLFPKNMSLKYRNGDIPAIDSLAIKGEGANNWFAICDPFAKDISKVQASIGKDQIYIVGVLIDRLPVWLYNTNPKITPAANEKELLQYKHDIESIRCYEKYNTGYLIGERLKNKFDFAVNKIIECKFGTEFQPPITQSMLIATSDILKIVPEVDKGHVVFNYPQRCSELTPFLFTAVLTLKSVIDEHLYSVLSVLAGLRTAIETLSADRVDSEHLKILTAKFGPLVSSTDPNERSRIIEKSIETLYKEENIYARNFDIEEAEKAYNIAKAQWELLLKNPFPEIEKCRDPIPSLLLKKNWQEDKTFITIFLKKLREKPQIPLKWTQKKYTAALACVLLALIVSLYSAVAILLEWNSIQNSKKVFAIPMAVIALIAVILQVYFSVSLYIEFMVKFETKRFWQFVTFTSICFTVVLGALALVS